jgi:hypothetical protein
MRSEAVSSLRSWARDRLGEQEEHLRSIERGVGRLGELDAERHEVLQALSTSVARLAELGLDDSQVTEFVGVDVARLRLSRGRQDGAIPKRSASSGPGVVTAP